MTSPELEPAAAPADESAPPEQATITVGGVSIVVKRPTEGQLAVVYRAGRQAQREPHRAAEALMVILDVFESMIINDDDRFQVVEMVATAKIDLDDLLPILRAFKDPQAEEATPAARLGA